MPHVNPPSSLRHALLACLGVVTTMAVAGEAAKSTDVDLLFRDADLTTEGAQVMAEYPDVEPGDSQKLERAFPGAPPQIPHVIDDGSALSVKENECLDCHHPDNATGKKDVPVPESHFSRPVTAETTGEGMASVVSGYEKADDVVGFRRNCTTCHTMQASNTEAYATTFLRLDENAPAPDAGKSKKSKKSK
ncbi:MAG: nitrate reductase cytochrome c-type subunit [Deltaproteobacteria bacterium]|nr:nitrate reductase cytochrome c-type subunit [Deltaproteobacteria bacterium]